MALSERDLRALKLGGVGLAIIAFYLLIADPAVNWYNGLVREHQRLANQIAHTIYEKDKQRHNARLVAEWEQKNGPLSAPKPYSEQITAVGNEIVTAGKKSGVKLKNTTPRAAVPWADDPRLQMASIHVDAETGWENVFKFIAAVYRIDGVLSVESVNLSNSSKKGGKMTLRMTISVMVAADQNGNKPWTS
ncbi:MAG: type 4a pilus biogenesis protein PilO [Planctomycetota bacterium]|jgi:hypothetical protein